LLLQSLSGFDHGFNGFFSDSYVAAMGKVLNLFDEILQAVSGVGVHNVVVVLALQSLLSLGFVRRFRQKMQS